MDTEAIYRAVCDYGQAKYRCWESDSADHLSEIKRLLKEAEDERAELLWENERLHDLAGGWKPIDSAPKDGTEIDLWVPGEFAGRYAECYWGKPMHCCGEYGSLCDDDWHSLDDGWVYGGIGAPPDEPSHWRPLPPPPEAA